MTDKIHILLVEDDHVWRTMLTRFINNEQDMHVIHSVQTKEEAVEYCFTYPIDIVLMDLNLTSNNLDGVQATLELSLKKNASKVIALTSLNDEQVIIDTYTAGAIHYISKSDFRIIPDVIRSVYSSISAQEILVQDYLRLKEIEQYHILTAAEHDIVKLSLKGSTREQIKETLNKSEGTLKNQITSILRKFQAKSMKEVGMRIKNRGIHHREQDQ